MIKAVILIDEYDVPLEHVYMCGFYDEMIAFIRSLFESSLKTNSSLEFAIITGCLRTSRESIFTGMKDRGYAKELEDDGYAAVYRYGIAFCGKDCQVKLQE